MTPQRFIGLGHRDEKKMGNILKHTKLIFLTKSIQNPELKSGCAIGFSLLIIPNSIRNPFTVPQSDHSFQRYHANLIAQSDLVCVIRLKGILESSWPQSSKTWHQPSKKSLFHSKFRLAAKTRDCFESRESKSPSPFRG